MVDAASRWRPAGRVTPMIVAAVGAAILLTALSTITHADSDLWGHLRFGLDILRDRGLTSVDPYSFTQDRPWVNHEWLSELQMGLAYTLGGVAGLALLKGTLVTIALGLVYASLLRVRTDARIVMLAALAAGTIPVTRTLRPQLWSLVALAILCRVLSEVDPRVRRWLPLLFAVWANCHGGWIVGGGILGLWTLAEAVDRRRLEVEPFAIAAACLLATLANPYGWNLWMFLATTVSFSGRAITEWQPLWNAPPADAVPWIAAVLAAVVLGRRLGPARLPRLTVLAFLAYASLSVVRIVPLFVLCAAVLLGPAFAARWPNARREGASAPGEMPVAIGIVIASVCGAAWLLSSSLECVRVTGDRVADARAVRLLMAAPRGRVVTFFDWGQYAIWHLSPPLRVSMDGRRETVYSDSRLDEHGAILDGTPAGLETLGRWQAEYVWLPATSVATRAWLVSNGYRLEHDTTHSFVAVRADVPALDEARAIDEEAFACFPG